jgi:hypothetical protein
MGHCGGSNDDTHEEAKARASNQVRSLAIPGVRCGKCLGRIDSGANEMKRKLHARLRPTESYVPPSLCSECWHGAVLALCEETDNPTDGLGDEEPEK